MDDHALTAAEVMPIDGGESPRRRRLTSASDLVELSPDHPGFNDAGYRRRRNTIARLAMEYREGDPVPRVRYTEAEQGVWRTIRANLDPLHERLACLEVLEASRAMALSASRIPQLCEVNETLRRTTGFQMVPVAGLVSDRRFLSCLARGIFLSTQYIRHPSMPRYTPEPDVVHELVGHAATFSNLDIARLNRAFGEAAIRASDSTLARIARVYWFTLEFGAVREASAARALGAGLLSSFGEIERLETDAELRPFDVERMAEHAYDPTQYQSVLYVAASFAQLIRETTRWLTAA